MFLADDLAPVVVDRSNIDGLKARAHAVMGSVAHDIGNLTRVQQGFRGNATAMKAGATDLVSFNQSDGPSELPGAQRRRIAPGAAAEDDDVEAVLAHRRASLSTNSMRLRVVAAVGPLSVKPNAAPLFMPTPAMSR